MSDDLPPGAVDGGRIPGIAAPRRYRGTPGPGTPRTRHDTRPRSTQEPTAAGMDGQHAPDASQSEMRPDELFTSWTVLAEEAAHHAQTQGGQAGIASGLAAIAYAILAGQEQDR